MSNTSNGDDAVWSGDLNVKTKKVDAAHMLLERTSMLATSDGVGLKDVCHVVWSITPSRRVGILGSARTFISESHYVCGVDTGSSASISAYFHRLIDNKTSKTSGSTVKFVKGIFCCHNIFTKHDLRVEVMLPGVCNIYYVSPKGIPAPLSEVTWMQTRVSSCLRAIDVLCGEFPSAADFEYSLVINPFFSRQQEDDFLFAVEKTFWDAAAVVPRGAERSNFNNMVMQTVLKYFISKCRYRDAEMFFARFLPSCPEIAILVSEVSRSNPRPEVDKAVVIVSRSLVRTHLENADLALEQAYLLALQGSMEAAIAMGTRAADLDGLNPKTWIVLSDIYADAYRPIHALAALNGATIDLESVENKTQVTAPSSYSDQAEKSGKTAEEDRLSARLPAGRLRGHALRAYEVLIKILKNHGWAGLLQARREVFYVSRKNRSKASQEENPFIGDVSPYPSTPTSRSPDVPQTPGPEDSDSKVLPQFPPCPDIKAKEKDAGEVRKRYCKRWLDQLFQMLYNDITFYIQHSTFSHTKENYSRKDLNNLVSLGLRMGDEAMSIEALHSITTKSVTASRTRLCALLTMVAASVQNGDTIQALRTVDVIGQTIQSAMPNDPRIPIARNRVAVGLFRLVSKQGMQEVASTLKKIKAHTSSPLCLELLKEAVVWKIDGFDK